MDQLIRAFDLSKVQKSGAIFSREKLDWFNRQYILKLSDQSFADHARPFLPEWLSSTSPLFRRIMPLLSERISSFGEITALLGKDGELGFAHAVTDYPREMLLWKRNPDPDTARDHLSKVLELLEGIPEAQFTAETIKVAVWPHAESNGKGDVLWPFRVALTGREKSPDPFVSAQILGRDESLKRIKAAKAKL
jgi:glutamyl/glutaminyl-tRNA synthetase